MKKLGFTLIELLAVIIILAIVALIATPIILNVIEDARISAGRSEANMILGGINNYCASEEMKYQLDNNYERICTSDMDKDDVPTMVNLGNATIEELVYDGEKLTTLVIKSNNHKFTLCSSGTFAMDDERCDGEVAITTKPLIDILLQQYQEENQTGLVKDSINENLYYYTGTNEQVSNNFLWYGGHQWRILEFDTEANTLTLITQQPLTSIQPTNIVWTDEKTYDSSYINKWLNEYFWNSLNSSIKSTILDNTFNVGIYGDTEEEQNVSEITTNKKVGLLDAEQYIKAGGANSFLNIKDYWWLGNRSNSSIIKVSSNGNFNDSFLTIGYGVRPIIKISNVNIIEGNGTFISNYKSINVSSNTNDVQVGEYINVPYNGDDNACGDDNMCTFRVVSKDNDSIKVILNGLLPNESVYDDLSVISSNSIIYMSLNSFANNISTNYRYAQDKVFYIGDYPYSESYEIVQDETLNSNVGLPTIGEMFSGNDIDLSYPAEDPKVFADVNTLENSTAASIYSTMNRFDSTKIYRVGDGGMLSSAISTGEFGVRPTLFLKMGLKFTGGDGTAQSPYTLQ